MRCKVTGRECDYLQYAADAEFVSNDSIGVNGALEICEQEINSPITMSMPEQSRCGLEARAITNILFKVEQQDA